MLPVSDARGPTKRRGRRPGIYLAVAATGLALLAACGSGPVDVGAERLVTGPLGSAAAERLSVAFAPDSRAAVPADPGAGNLPPLPRAQGARAGREECGAPEPPPAPGDVPAYTSFSL
jgi:hypothetical protein